MLTRPKLTPCVLVCEGEEDKAFFEKFIELRSLPRITVTTTADERGRSGGNTRFGDKLRRLRLQGLDGVKHIILVTDADDDAEERFRYLSMQISEAGFGPPPTARYVRSTSNPPITVVTIPMHCDEGCLETICQVVALNSDRAIASMVDNFIDLVSRDRWGMNQKSKAWLRSNLAVRAKDPFVPLEAVFRDPRNNNLIPLNDQHLCDLEVALREFIDQSIAKRTRKTIINITKKQNKKKTSATAPFMRKSKKNEG